VDIFAGALLRGTVCIKAKGERFEIVEKEAVEETL
jgi:hypothetical protein